MPLTSPAVSTDTPVDRYDKHFVPKGFFSAEPDKDATTTSVKARTKRSSGRTQRAEAPGRKSHPGASVARKKFNSSDTIRILVVDDHPLFRHGLVQLLNSEKTFQVVGEASSAPEALTRARQLIPTMAIIDLGLKGPSGLELTKSLRVEFPKMPVLVLSMHDEPTYAVRSLRAGANGYVTKEEALASVLVAVREVINGRTYLSPGMASEVISNVVLSKSRPGATPTDQLTDRELEILDRIGKGEEVKDIAEALHLSPKTVETHRAHIKEKLNLKNAREVARFAVQWSSARSI
jgi:DNA-binding NarL/FixJ family response regulator